MFWIGFIVGIVAFVTVALAYLAWCMYVTGTSLEDFGNMAHANTTAIVNRKSYMQVFTDDDILETVTLEER